MKISNRLVGVAVGALLVAGSASSAYAGLIGPDVNYLSFADSPFAGLSFSYFHLDTFEPGSSAPGATFSAGFIDGPGAEIDSVDGQGPNGHSLFSGNGAAGITFTFDKSVLGQLPTDAGIVWTDGDGPNRTFEAFDENGNSLGTIIDSTPLFFSSGGDGDFHNYRFFGATNAGGISSIFIANDGGGIEVDHLQYGLLNAGVPEPATWGLMIGGFGLAGATLRRRRAVVSA
ncbi:MAG TPA: PEPxxWA-CTERM sorting domain-containing protein [Phenylobacterium sp.]|jgi:hypothetical protein|nr:PEPxxWA-CTERM sorting domain-containing protein [Phenylobacterium sp.]